MQTKKINLYAGCSIDEAYYELHKCQEPCYTIFNGKELTSDETLDEMYVKILGISKKEFDSDKKKFISEYERSEQEHKSKISKLTEYYCKEARCVILEDQLEYWDEIVPIRFDDLYHGMELDQALTISRIILKVPDSIHKCKHCGCKFKLEKEDFSKIDYGFVGFTETFFGFKKVKRGYRIPCLNCYHNVEVLYND